MKRIIGATVRISVLLVWCAATYGAIEFGGSLENKVTYAPLDENSPINPGNVFGLTEVTVENIFKLKMDADLAEGASARIWLTHKYVPLGRIFAPQIPESERKILEAAYGPLSLGTFELEQAYIDLGFWDALYVRAGKQLIPWGTGYAWNPTDNFNPTKNPMAPTAERVGVNALSVDVPLGNIVTFSAVGLPQEELGRTVGAGKVRANLFDLYDVSASVYGGRGHRTIGGLDFAGQLWELGVHGETTIARGSDLLRFEKHTETVPLLVDGAPVGEMEAEVYSLKPPNREKFYPELVLGADYTLPWGTFALVEYYRNEEGYDEGEMKAYTDLLKLVRRSVLEPKPDTSEFDPPTRDALKRIESSVNEAYATALSYFSPGRMRKNYVFVHVDHTLLDLITLNGDVLLGLDDMSAVTMPSVDFSVVENVTLTLRSDIVSGKPDAEFRLIPFSYDVSVGLKANF